VKKTTLFLLAVFGVAAPGAADGDPYGNMAQRLAGMAPNGRLAVLPLVYVDGRESPGSFLAAEALEERLAGMGKFKILGQTAQAGVLSDAKWQKPSDARTEKAQAIGRRLGAAAVVVGSLRDSGDGMVKVTTKLVDTKSGRTLAQATERVPKTWREAGGASGGSTRVMSFDAFQFPIGKSLLDK